MNPEEELSLSVARDILVQAIEDGTGLDEETMERAAAAVHQAWIDRHPHPNNPLDHRPYSDLPEAEREKDRQFVRRAAAELNQAST